MTVQISPKVFGQFMAARQIGTCNMLDRNGVQNIANDNNMYELVVWIEDNKKQYGELVFGDFQIVDENGEPTEYNEETDGFALPDSDDDEEEYDFYKYDDDEDDEDDEVTQ